MYNLKKAVGLIMVPALCISLSACGKSTDTVVDDYGLKEGTVVSSDTNSDGSVQGSSKEDTISSAGDSTSENNISGAGSLIFKKGDEKTLQDTFSQTVRWQEEFAIGDTSINANATYSIPDTDYLNVYNMLHLDDGKSDEEAIVKALFGDTSQKIDMLEYKNQYDYMPLFYKYRSILIDREIYCRNQGKSSTYSIDIMDKSIIDSTFSDIYNWKDSDDMYIHMYEGDYLGQRFTLLLAYDYMAHKRYIFFEPLNVNEYFPEFSAKTLLITGSNDSTGKALELNNACEESIEDIKYHALSFMEEKLGIKSGYRITEDSEKYREFMSDSLIESTSPIYVVGANISYDYGLSVLKFSDSDFLTTLRSDREGLSVDYNILAEQRDLHAEYIAEHPNSQKTIYELLYSQSPLISDIEEPNFNVDGYAVYIDTEGKHDAEQESISGDYINLNPSNAGCFKYTSKGLYGVDLELSNQIIDVTENVQLLEFDKIIERTKSEMETKLDTSVLDSPSSFKLIDMQLDYGEYFENEGDTSYYEIPTWYFYLIADDNPAKVILVSVNAMDGSITDTVYWNYDNYN